MSPSVPKKKKVQVVNQEKLNNQTIKKQKATEGQSTARKKSEDARKKIADGRAKKADLEERAKAAKTAKEKAQLKDELEKADKEIAQGDTEMKGAQAEEERFRKEEEEAANENVYDEMELDDPDNPVETTETTKITETSDPLGLVTALLAGTTLGDPPVPLDVSLGAGLSKDEKVIGYKNGLGKVGIVCNYSIEGWPVYRIRRNVVIGDKVPNIIKDRRAGTLKDEVTGAKWGWSDALAVRGIAIAVPNGHTGNVEDLVLPVKKYSIEEKVAMKAAKEPIPKQPDVQVLIEWKSKDKNGKVLSWESRSTSAALWKKATPRVLWDAATHFEGYFRDGGGEDVAPFGMPYYRDSLSRESSVDQDQLASTKTTPGTSPKTSPEPQQPPTDKKAARQAFFNEYMEDRGLTFETIKPEVEANMRDTFDIKWELQTKRQSN